jgi:hypothetical protein
MHRLVCPLRYPTPAAQGNAYSDGVWAPPGNYTVELTVDGKRYRQPLIIAPDPRIDLPPSAYVGQFALAKRVEALQVRLDAANGEAGVLRKSVAERRKGADGGAAAALDQFGVRLAAVSGAQPAPNPFNASSFPPQQVQTLAFLGSALGNLMAAVDGADAAPSPDAQTGYTKLAALTDATLHAWDDFKRSDLATLNAALHAAHAKPIDLKPAK